VAFTLGAGEAAAADADAIMAEADDDSGDEDCLWRFLWNLRAFWSY